MAGVLLLLLSTPFVLSESLSVLPDKWDIRAAYPLCRAWGGYDQIRHDCAQCCPMAIAAALGVRDCIISARDSRFSAQQIWDCTGDGIASCADGVLLNQMLRSMGSNAAAPYVLLPETCAPETGGAPNMSACIARVWECPPPTSPHPPPNATLFVPASASARSAVSYEVLQFRGTPSSSSSNSDNGPSDIPQAMHSMMHEILTNGPVVSVLTLSGNNIQRFVDWKDPGNSSIGSEVPIFQPDRNLSTFNLASSVSFSHCILVYGWGVSRTRSGESVPYWLVQNSYGEQWGRNGTARVARGNGLLETSWRAVSLVERPCVKEGCLPRPYGQYRATPILTMGTMPAPPISRANDDDGIELLLLSRPLPSSHNTPRISNLSILVIAFAVAAIVTTVGLYFFRGTTDNTVYSAELDGPSWIPHARV